MAAYLNRPEPYLATAAFALLILWYIRRQPRRTGTNLFTWLMIVWMLWALGAALTTLVHTPLMAFACFLFQVVCCLLVAGLEMVVILEYTGNHKWIRWGRLAPLYCAPLLFAMLAIFFPSSIVSLEYHAGTGVLMVREEIKWGVYSYLLAIALLTSAVLLTCMRQSPSFHSPLLLLLVGPLFPLFGYLLVEPLNITVSPVQATLLLANLTMLCYSIALNNFHILQVAPVARDAIVSHMPYDLIVLDSENHLVDFNPPAQALPGLPGRLVLHQSAERTLGVWWERLHPMVEAGKVSRDLAISVDNKQRIYHVIGLPLAQPSGWHWGYVILMEDVTEARHVHQQQLQEKHSQAIQQERERLAREMHDSLGQTLAAAHLQASTARILLNQGQLPQVGECLDQLAEMTFLAEADVREYLLGVRTTLSAERSFFDTLRLYTSRYSQQAGLRIEVVVPPQLEAHGLGLAVELQLLRIIQEALSNVRKHAHAKAAWVEFSESGSWMKVVIRDDGQGFDATTLLGAEGFGLQSMRERAESLGGHLDVRSRVGEGAQVLLELPVAACQEVGEEVL